MYFNSRINFFSVLFALFYILFDNALSTYNRVNQSSSSSSTSSSSSSSSSTHVVSASNEDVDVVDSSSSLNSNETSQQQVTHPSNPHVRPTDLHYISAAA
ncbi:hypothetical protein BDF22DRAFT_745895 [Syncephalis plumigaleata]|nr:hypothetical protein BDF22DRAFT_745895 [Syncephalis plumigaleata]